MKNRQKSDDKKRSSQDWEAYSLGLISVAAFGMTLPMAKLLVGDLTAMQVGIYRSFLAALPAIAIIILLRVPFPSRSQVKRLFLTSLGIIYGFPILTVVGMQYVPVSHGGVVLAVLPVATSLFGSLITKTNPSKTFWFISILGFLTVFTYTLIRNDVSGLYIGDWALLGAVVLAGYGYAQGGALSRELPGWQVMCWTLVINLPILAVLTFLLYDHQEMVALNRVDWGALAFLAFINSLLGFFSWNRALAIGGIQRISQLQLVQPFFTFAAAMMFMGEVLDWSTITACVIVIMLVWLSKRV